MDGERTYLCIDLKSFYASVECVERGLDPFTTNLIVADRDRTDKTVCLAITPAMKALGVSNRCRVFEIPETVDFIWAPPRLRHYMEVSADIYGIYLRYVSPEDVHVYSIDECFIDATPYLRLYNKEPRDFAKMLMDAVYDETGICATAGVGTNLFLAKVALDVTAKHVDDHIGMLDEESFKREIWHHRPITDIWNVGPGIARRLEKYAVFDLAGVCEMNPETLYREFGVNAEYLIDHAHGIEPCTIADIQAYIPDSQSISSGQVLGERYNRRDARILVREMVEAMVLELVEKGMAAGSISLLISYAEGEGWVPESEDPVEWSDLLPSADEDLGEKRFFEGGHGKRLVTGRYGPHTGGTRKLAGPTDSRRKIMDAFLELYDETTVDGPIHNINVGLGLLVPQEFAGYDLFADVAAEESERRLQKAILDVRDKFGKNAVMKATSLQEKATGRNRNRQVGGHRA